MKLRIARKLDRNLRSRSRRAIMEERRPVHTFLRAVTRLRKSWRSACPLRIRDGKTSRPTGLDLPVQDYFSANRLGVLAWRLTWLRQPGGFDGAPPPHWYHADIFGKTRSLQ